MYSLILSGYNFEDFPSLKIFSLSHDSISPITELHALQPSFACHFHPFIFTLSELDDKAQIQMYAWENHQLRFLDELSFEAGGLCHISYSPKHHTLFGACYQTGHIFSVGIVNEKFTPLKSLIHLPSFTQDGLSRAHCTQMDPAEKFLYATNIHTDTLYCYRIENGMLLPNSNFSTLQLPSGNGPRHIIFHPTLNIGYIITEYSNKIFVVKQDASTGKLEMLQEINTLPKDYDGKSYCSNCIITTNQKYLLAANRGHNSITRFEIQADGSLKYLDFYPCGGVWPRHISCTHDGKRLMVCNQNSNDVTIFRLDENTGALCEEIAHIAFPNPSFIDEI